MSADERGKNVHTAEWIRVKKVNGLNYIIQVRYREGMTSLPYPCIRKTYKRCRTMLTGKKVNLHHEAGCWGEDGGEGGREGSKAPRIAGENKARDSPLTDKNQFRMNVWSKTVGRGEADGGGGGYILKLSDTNAQLPTSLIPTWHPQAFMPHLDTKVQSLQSAKTFTYIKEQLPTKCVLHQHQTTSLAHR